MFFQNNFATLPVEIIFDIINRLPLNDALSSLKVSKEMNNLIQDRLLWKKFGARDFEDFVKRIKNLPERYQKLILEETLPLAWAEVFSRPAPQRDEADPEVTLPVEQIRIAISVAPELTEIFTDLKEFDTNKNMETLFIYIRTNDPFRGTDNLQHFLLSLEACCIAFRENIFTFNQLKEMTPNKCLNFLTLLKTPNGLSALRQKLVTPQQLADATEENIQKLITENNPKLPTCKMG